ncbi:MAG: c-type heme family protein, partial [Candidatus Anammoxibacter sp.]
MKLRSKFILIIIGLTIVVFSIGQYLNYRNLKKHIAEIARNEAANIAGFFESLDYYLDMTFTENDLPVNEDTFPFISAKAITEIATLFSSKTGGITFRHVSVDPRNPENRANADEKNIINLFTENIDNKEYFGEHNYQGKDYFIYARPYVIEKKCLKCHGKREDAPEYIRNNYDKSYGYEVGDLRGIACVKIPKDAINKIAKGNMDYRIDKVSGDELGQISESFNAMVDNIKRSNEDVRLERERLSVTLQSIGDGVITTDNVGKVIMLNAVAEGLTGWTRKQATGKHLQDVFNIVNEKTRERCENPVEKVLESGQIVEIAYNTILVARNGNEPVIEYSGAPIRDKDMNIIGVVMVFRDITEKQKKEDEVLRAQKLDSIGVLAGGIAHDFNNMLTAIMGNLSLAMIYASNNDKVHGMLLKVEKASLRTAELVQQLLVFSKGGAPIKNTASVRELIKETSDFALKGSNVRCEYDIPEDILPIDADEGQISQVINNLIINADQAMPDGGIIKVQAENV